MSVFPLFYLAPIRYYADYLNHLPNVVFEIHEHFIKQSYRTRCEIYAANGKLPLIIPVHKPFGNKTPMKDIRISYMENWQKNHWKSIESAYRTSPFFDYYEHLFIPFYEKKFEYLTDFNLELHQTVCKLLQIPSKTGFTTEYQKQVANDYRNYYSPKKAPNAISPYPQVFAEKHGFIHNLSIIDLLFN
ncbi:MAG: hypothetical protein D6707_09925, partial [Bacteroidetes bacterium]